MTTRPAAGRLRGLRLVAVAVGVGLVLGDSSIVVLALPDVLASFSTSIARVAWVLVAFNLVLAAVAVPAARISRRVGARAVMRGGLALLAASSAACASAGSIDGLIAARCVQAVGAAAVVGAALELLTEMLGDEPRAARWWTWAGATGAALGPGIGGVVTQLISWRAVFAIQVPAACALIVVLWAQTARRPLDTPRQRPRIAVNVALGLVSAALTGALFLLVLMLVDGWRMSPVTAALTVSVMPAAAIAAAPLVPRMGSLRTRAAAGCLLIAGGVGAFGELPRGVPAWTFAPQVLVGVGLALALSAMTEAALHRRSPEAVHGAWTITARHAGVVAGLLLLTPIFTTDLTTQAAAARESGSAIVLDANLPLGSKLALGRALTGLAEQSANRVPDLAPAFRAQHPSASARPEYRRVESALEGQVRRAGTAAFARVFAIAGLIALAALIPLAADRIERGASA